jgi:PRTRC genetic system protein C
VVFVVKNDILQNLSIQKKENLQMPESTVTAPAVPRRKFVYNGMELDDPDPKMTPEKVCEFHALLRSELTNAVVKGPTRNADGVDEYKIELKVGKFG